MENPPLKSSTKKVTFNEESEHHYAQSNEHERYNLQRAGNGVANQMGNTATAQIGDKRVIRESQPINTLGSNIHVNGQKSTEPRVIRVSTHKADANSNNNAYQPAWKSFGKEEPIEKKSSEPRIIRSSLRRTINEDNRLLYSQQVVNSPYKGQAYHSVVNNYTPTINKNSYLSNRQDVANDIATNNMVNELKFQISKKDSEIDQLESENSRLRKEVESLAIVKGRLEEAKNEKQRVEGTSAHLESIIKSLKEEVQRLTDRNLNLQQQMNTIMAHNPGRYRHDGDHVYTKKEWDLIEEKKQLEAKLYSTEKERDRLYIENYEFKRQKGIVDADLDETNDEMMQLGYQNELQLARLGTKKIERKYKRLEEERNIMYKELQILRALDTEDETGVRSKLIRKAPGANGRVAKASQG